MLLDVSISDNLSGRRQSFRRSDLSPHIRNSGIVIENCEIIDGRNGIVMPMLDRMGVLTAKNTSR